MEQQPESDQPSENLHQHPRDAFRQFLRNAFVLPFKDPVRSFVYFVSFFFAFGSAFLDVFMTIDAAGMGERDITLFLLAKFGSLSLLIPAGLLGMGKVRDGVFYGFLIGTMLLGLAYIALRGGDISSFESGFFYGLFVSPFWSIFHIMFAAATSDKNIGNEVSLASTGMTVGITFGALAGGACSQMHLEEVGTITGFVILTASILCLIRKAVTSDLINTLRRTGAIDEKLSDALKRCKYRSLGSLLEGIFNIIGGNLWMVYLRFAGIAAAAVGAWTSAMVVAKIIMTPFAGALVNHGKRREMVLGSGLNLLGWTPFMFGAKSLIVMASMNVWAVGAHLFSTGLTSAWYGSRTIAAIVVRELIMGASRITAILLLTPVLYDDPAKFIDISIIIGAVTVVYSALWMRSVRMKGPVLPIENVVTKV